MNCMRSLRLLLLPALLNACSDSRSTLDVSLNALTDSDLGTVTVSVDHPDGRATFNIDDFAIAPGSTILHVGPFRVPDDGEASVVMTYTDPQGVVFEAEGKWALRPHFAWSLGVAGVAPDDRSPDIEIVGGRIDMDAKIISLAHVNLGMNWS